MKANYDHKPSKLKKVGDGSYLWRWDITRNDITNPHTGVVHPNWNCNEIVIWNEPTEKKIKKAVIAEVCDPSDESKLINDYIASLEGGADNKQPWRDFIAERNRLKKDVADYFANK